MHVGGICVLTNCAVLVLRSSESSAGGSVATGRASHAGQVEG